MRAMDLIDIGCNLTHDSFEDDRDEVITAAHDAGVVEIIVTGASAEGSQMAHRLAGDLALQRAPAEHRLDAELEDLKFFSVPESSVAEA